MAKGNGNLWRETVETFQCLEKILSRCSIRDECRERLACWRQAGNETKWRGKLWKNAGV